MCRVEILMIPLCVFLFTVCVTSAVSGNQPNSCPRNTRIKKADGSYYQTLTHVCCPDYRELNDKCVACEPGYYGQNCSHKCETGSYGVGCKQTCQCNNKQTCHFMDGCVCKPGTMGSGCDEVCSEGRFGIRCEEQCQCSSNSKCHHVTGRCDCDPGYNGKTCHDHCLYPRFGHKCSKRCHCPRHNSCHPVTGECACPSGFTGEDCTNQCPDGKYGVGCEGNCACHSGLCNFTNGKCSCFPGYTGRLCSEECKDGLYGDKCQHQCNCSDDRICYHVTGECHCSVGKSGPACTDDEDSSTTGIAVGVVFALFIPITAVIGMYVLYQQNYLKCLHDSDGKQTNEDDSVHYEDIEDYAEIPEEKMIQNFQYCYADSDSAAPPVKPREREKTSRKVANPYLSLPDADIASQKSVGNTERTDRKTKELSKDYTDLLRKGKCDSYQGFGKDRGASTVSTDSVSGYLKPSIRRKLKTKSQQRKGNVYTGSDQECKNENVSLEDDRRGSYIKLSAVLRVDEQNDVDDKTDVTDDTPKSKDVRN